MPYTSQLSPEQLAQFFGPLSTRCNAHCELCDAETGLALLEVASDGMPSADHCAMLCPTCRDAIVGEGALDVHHWRCLQQSAWSQVPVVQVLVWRLLKKLNGESWAQELTDQIFLDEETMAWAEQGGDSADDEEPTLDSLGTRLADGDTVQIIKDLDVKGTSFVAKRGTIVKGIRLTSNPEHVEGRVNKTAIVLKTCFLKKTEA